ncbi:hypothetical protein GGQ74_000864 [Desulfobaculum xiamenense]|uniref:Bacteriophage T5 Orf172 DNA-binding domain-containing protein n=1 Tax=Desulfobaculum xiamenense TaxID=995050 RepID=A0A846QPT2_9BACT|nr:DUF4041 domain-containing protein [Desulfobaculum xiamenense]NJB67224.1 hypothetical protein [Desulfobaculum xiamenense]
MSDQFGMLCSVLVITIGLLVFFIGERKRLNKALKEAEQKVSVIFDELNLVKNELIVKSEQALVDCEELKILRKYKGILSAEAESLRIKREAQDVLREAKEKSLRMVQEIESDKQKILLGAKEEAEQSRNICRSQLDDAKKQIQTMRRDAEVDKNRILSDAADEAKRLRDKGQGQLDQARKNARRINQDVALKKKELLAETRAETKRLREVEQIRLEQAAETARRIVAEAKDEAERIAGDAYKAKGKAEMYAKTVQAMRNMINGYGDEYLVPNRSVLDILADEFEYKQAGEELKKARKHTREMIKQGLAATCEYVEKYKRETAIRFVLDAFNGRVDTALSKVRHDNLGKLKQEILDAFNLVNRTGEAFRNARIEPQYLKARLDELRWAVTTQELKLEANEEQRRINEIMREEEKARQEYEKAKKEAEKEEKSIIGKMMKTQKALEQANEEQREVFEQQLQELQEKLAEAEAKNARALSMAQQTRCGHVYVISNIGSFGEDIYKIGMTRRLEPLDRVRELGDASVPFPFDVHAMLFSDDAPALENALHHVFKAEQINLVNNRKEFFKVGITQIRKAVERMGVEAHWTMHAEASQYKESEVLRKASLNPEEVISAA